MQLRDTRGKFRRWAGDVSAVPLERYFKKARDLKLRTSLYAGSKLFSYTGLAVTVEQWNLFSAKVRYASGVSRTVPITDLVIIREFT